MNTSSRQIFFGAFGIAGPAAIALSQLWRVVKMPADTAQCRLQRRRAEAVGAPRRCCAVTTTCCCSTSPTTFSTFPASAGSEAGAARQSKDDALRQPRPRNACRDRNKDRHDRSQRCLDSRERFRRVSRGPTSSIGEPRKHALALYEDERKKLEELVVVMRQRAKISDKFAPRLKAAESRLRQFLERSDASGIGRSGSTCASAGGVHRQARSGCPATRTARPDRSVRLGAVVRRARSRCSVATVPARATSCGCSAATRRCRTAATSVSAPESCLVCSTRLTSIRNGTAARCCRSSTTTPAISPTTPVR